MPPKWLYGQRALQGGWQGRRALSATRPDKRWRHDALLAALSEPGVEVTGRVAGKHKSTPSPGRSVSVGFLVDLTHIHCRAPYANTYPVSSREHDGLAIGDPVELIILPDEPRLGQRAAVVRGEADFSGFIPVDR